METCISPDGTLEHLPTATCHSMGLEKYQWQPEPFHHMWMALHSYTVQFILVLVGLLVLVYFLSNKNRSDDKDHTDHLV